MVAAKGFCGIRDPKRVLWRPCRFIIFPVIVRRVVWSIVLILFCALPLGWLLALDAPSGRDDAPLPIPPAKSIGSGLLLEPDLDLSWFSRDDFIAMSSGIGTNRINKQWTSPVV